MAGIDEAGRGPLAGPVTAATIVLPSDYRNPRVTDSKKLSARIREELFSELVSQAEAYSIVSVGPRRIEKLNIREATRLAMRLSAEKVCRELVMKGKNADVHFLIDGNMTIGGNLSQEAIVKGDSKVLSISAASILAKVTRDRLMCRLEERYPGYGLSDHKGYPTATHRENIKKFGPSRIHRRTFAGVREYIW